MDWLIELLKWLIPTIIAVIGIVFGIMQRKIAKKEISKKRHLQKALSNLSDVIEIAESLPTWIEFDRTSDIVNDTDTLINDILRASFATKKKRLNLEISYFVIDYGDTNTPFDKRYTSKEFSLQKKHNQDWLSNILTKEGRRIRIYTETEIKDYSRYWGNSPDFNAFVWAFRRLLEITNKLSAYEEVYETLACNSLNEFRDTSTELGKALSGLMQQEKRLIEINLDALEDFEMMRDYLWDQIFDYSNLKKIVVKTSGMVPALKKARKELF